MNDEQADAGTSGSGPAFIKRKGKARGTTAVSAPSRSSLLKSNEQETANEDEEPVAVRRTTGIGSRGKLSARGGTAKTARLTAASALSFGDEAIEPAFELKKSALAQAARETRKTGDDTPPVSLDQANIVGSSHEYSASALAALKASTPARRRVMQVDGDLDLAHQEMLDPTTQYDENGNSLSRPKFGADFTLEGIPSEALVNAAKERRRRAAEDGVDVLPSENFISLRDSTVEQEPHPESRLQREEDDEGSGEDDFAEFTGATERVALGQKAVKQAKKRELEDRREAMDLDEDDDSGQEWERAQMGRIDAAGSRKQFEKREKSPFRPAPIPMTAPLPTLSSTSARLAVKVAALESSIKSHGQVIDDAIRQLQQMEGDEIRNKTSIEIIGEKEAWFRELQDFVVSLSTFLDEKMPLLEEIEMDWKQILVERSQIAKKAKITSMTDQACLFHGVPDRSLLPKDVNSVDELGEEEKGPQQDGVALSAIRETRRADDSASIQASWNEETTFSTAQKNIRRRLRQLLDDVKAPEFTDPAVRLESRLHPSSLVARFHQWRRLYPEEYASAWGGLTLAGMWEFWVRREICGWDLVEMGSQGLDDFQWHKEMTKYSALTSHQNGKDENDDKEEAHSEQLGGDDEIISHVISNTIVPRIIDAIEAGTYNPWSRTNCQSMMDLLEQISYVLERDNVRFISLVSTFLNNFQSQIDTINESMSFPPISAPPPFDPRTPIALLAFLESIKILLFNLLMVNRYVLTSERSFYLDLIDRLVGKLIWNLLDSAKETGGKQIAQEILQRCEKGSLLREDVRARLSAMANSI